jgi:hypothetical protein
MTSRLLGAVLNHLAKQNQVKTICAGSIYSIICIENENKKKKLGRAMALFSPLGFRPWLFHASPKLINFKLSLVVLLEHCLKN